MRGATGRALCVLAALGGGTLFPLAATAETSPAAIIHATPHAVCSGSSATLVWSPPEGVSGLTGYRIEHMVVTASTPQFFDTYVGPEPTSLPFTVPFGISTFQISAITSSGVGGPYTSATITGNRAPTPMAWDSDPSASAVGDGTATVPFKWHNPKTFSAAGGVLPATVEVTASPGGASISTTVSSGTSVAPAFTGLTNGLAYRFRAVTSNACGVGGSTDSPSYVPGVAPAWTQASPPLTLPKNKTYSYEFVASGDPAPRYLLLGAPDWLELGPGGLVTGDPPKGTTSFSYSIAAVGAGWEPSFGFVSAGPFTVDLTRGWRGER